MDVFFVTKPECQTTLEDDTGADDWDTTRATCSYTYDIYIDCINDENGPFADIAETSAADAEDEDLTD